MAPSSELELEDYEDDEDEYQGSLEGESEDEWAEERKAVRYMAESEIEDGLDSMSDEDTDAKFPPSRKKIPTPSNKHAPIEITSKRAVTRKRRIVELPKIERRDPRFDPLSGALNEDLHEKSFGFLRSQRQAEMEKMRELVRKAKSEIEDGLDSMSEEDTDAKFPPSRKKIPTRSNKHAPIEITSKRAVTRKRRIVELPKIERRDPRFDPLSGALNEDLHEKSFGFLRSQRQAEMEKMRELVRKAKKTGRKSAEVEKLEAELRREENREVQREKIEREKQVLRAWKATEREKRKEGKGAFYLNRKAQKEIVLADRYEHLSQDKVKLQKSIEKRRKKIDGKVKKSMPSRRQRSNSNNFEG